MSFFSKRKGLKSAFVCAAMTVGLGGFAAYSHIEKDEPNPMALIFASVFGGMAVSSFKDYHRDVKEAKNAKDSAPAP